MNWEKNIFGLVKEPDLLQIGQTVTRPNDPVDSLFGDEKTSNLFARWQTIANEYRLPMMAQFHAFDTEARTTIRVPVDTHNIEKGLIKVKINQSERLRELMRAGVRDTELYNYVMDDAMKLAVEVENRTKIAKNEVMATGKMTIKENGLNETVDYGVPAANVSYTIDLDTSADLPAQIQGIVDDAAKKGVTINGMMTNRKNISKMRQNELLQTFVYGTNGAGTLIRYADFNAFMDSEFGIGKIISNDQKYNAETGINKTTGRPIVTAKPYFPDNKITFFATNPGGKLGVGLWGDPPEIDASYDAAGQSSENNYIYVTQWAEKDPAVTWTKASALFVPVLYNPDSLFIGTISD